MGGITFLIMPKKLTKAPKPEPTVKKVEVDGGLAVVEMAGKQHLVKIGQTLVIDRQPNPVGTKIETEKLLLAARGPEVKIGQPYLNGAKVTLEILENLKGKKIEIIKYKAKSRYRKHTGHRSHLTKVKVININL